MPQQVPGNTLECWYSPRAFPAPSYLNLLFSCSHTLLLPRAKLMLKVGQKGDRALKQLRPLFLTHLGTAAPEPPMMSQPVGHHVTPRLAQLLP